MLQLCSTGFMVWEIIILKNNDRTVMRYSSIIKKYIFVDIFFWIVQIVNTDELIKCCSYTKILSTATFEMLHLKSLCCRQCQG